LVELRYTGGTSNSFSTASIGGEMSSVAITTDEFENLFDNVNRVEVINGRTEFRCFAIINTGVQKHYRVKFASIVIPPDTEIAFATEDGSKTPQLLLTEDTSPVGLSFFDLAEWNEFEVPIGKLDIGERMFIWMRRKVVVGSDQPRIISFNIDGEDNNLSISQDFHSIENGLDNDYINNISPLFFTDEAIVGESLTS